jgi:hypothetical protein
MAQNSRFWNGIAVGDAVESPYDAPTEFGKVLSAMIGAESMADKGTALLGVGNELEPTIVGATVEIDTGQGWVAGSWYENTVAVATAIPNPAAATRIYRIVLRKDWAAQTVRITSIASAEGDPAPAITQTFGTTWDVPLVKVTITFPTNVITIVDERPTPFLAATTAMDHYHTGAPGDGPQLDGWDALSNISATAGNDKVLGTDATGQSQVEDPGSGKDIVNYQTVEDVGHADTQYDASVIGLSGWTLAAQKVVTTTKICNFIVIGSCQVYGPGSGNVVSLLQMDAVLGEERSIGLLVVGTLTIHMFFADVAAGAHTFSFMLYPSVASMYTTKNRISVIALPAL